MKFAFLLLCHKNPKQINLLLEKLDKFDCDVYIHIDKKKYKVIIDKLIKKSNIHIISYDSSYDVKWGGIEMIQATLKLIEQAYKSNIKYDYLWLLSGQDYIIKKPSYIIEKMKRNLDYNYIEIIDEDNKRYLEYKKLYEVYYWSWMTKNRFINKAIKRIYMLITGGFKNTFSIFKRKKTFPFKFYFGSQWWTLKSETVYQIFEYVEKNPKIVEYWNLIMNNKQHFFARKFDINVDEEIINKINMNIEY